MRGDLSMHAKSKGKRENGKRGWRGGGGKLFSLSIRWDGVYLKVVAQFYGVHLKRERTDAITTSNSPLYFLSRSLWSLFEQPPIHPRTHRLLLYWFLILPQILYTYISKQIQEILIKSFHFKKDHIRYLELHPHHL